VRPINETLGWTIFGVVWAMAALGVTLTAIDLKKYRIFSMVSYLGMGWCIIVAFGPMVDAFGWGPMRCCLQAARLIRSALCCTDWAKRSLHAFGLSPVRAGGQHITAPYDFNVPDVKYKKRKTPPDGV
jgi:hypothetical protein